jgi:hypothetical protein
MAQELLLLVTNLTLTEKVQLTQWTEQPALQRAA